MRIANKLGELVNLGEVDANDVVGNFQVKFASLDCNAADKDHDE